MYIENGIAYAGEKTPMLKVYGIRPMEGYKLWLRFSDGTTKVFDFTQILKFYSFGGKLKALF